MIVADFNGLTVVATEELRNKCKEENVEFLAVKKTLLKKLISELKLEGQDKIDYSGSMAVAFGREDEVAPAKILADFAKNHEEVQFRGGIVENEIIDIPGIKALAALPSKLELYAKIVGSINAPISGFVNVLAGTLRSFVTVINNIKDNK
ncbi:50S ribosomal protein L10 [Candidatus Falkowbacteria bacterium RIFOXYA2_FULL_35_8]|nr:MAG: 50S ribosomal protein L10 [Candidatus Falkowbacteria bacterium RIFOXYA2_FULL_35_8]